MKKYLSYIVYGVLGIIALYFVITSYTSIPFYIEYVEEDAKAKEFLGTLQENDPEIEEEGLGRVFAYTSSIIGVSYVFFFILLLATLVNAGTGLVVNPRSALMSLISLVALGILFGIAYAVASGAIKPDYAQYGVAETESQLIGGMIYLTYFLMILAIIGILFSEVSKAIK